MFSVERNGSRWMAARNNNAMLLKTLHLVCVVCELLHILCINCSAGGISGITMYQDELPLCSNTTTFCSLITFALHSRRNEVSSFNFNTSFSKKSHSHKSSNGVSKSAKQHRFICEIFEFREFYYGCPKYIKSVFKLPSL